ncbi:MAG: Eco57I restriction-modification methylase domain-containing protein [Solirubrobacteraceae bacterium]
MASALPPQIPALEAIVDERAGLYRSLNGGRNLSEYLARDRPREDEELLTEPLLRDLIERVLGFPVDAYFPQLGRSGLKPDFTPVDLVAHRFVLDAKSSTQDLTGHEEQIRAYVDQRHLDFGVLFNLRELRVYRRGQNGHDPALSFQVERLWEVARGEALATEEVDRFVRFCGLFSHRAMAIDDKILMVAEAKPWRERAGAGEQLEIDLDFLVSQLRTLSRTLADDAAAQHEILLRDLELEPARERSLRLELETLAREIEPGIEAEDLPVAAPQYPEVPGVPRRAWAQYLMRVSQLTLTRILLYRSWEDVGFVEDRLYDGGFEQAYERLNRRLRRVLDEAFRLGRERYRWLFGEDNNYDWYRPRDEALADVLYALVPIPLGRLGADVLGGLYESYVDDIDRDRLGQFYTPRSVVRFMLDQVGFAGPEGVFRIEGDERTPRQVFDFATGSGGFLVEAARRIVDDGGLDPSDPRDLRDGLRAIVRGFHGCEISPFPYYLTEVNLLLQVSRILGRLHEMGEDPPGFTLGVVHTDSLSARRGPDDSFGAMDPGLRADAALLASDERYGIVPLDQAKEQPFREIRENDRFDLVVGNPPYVFESGNKVLFDRLRALPGWKDDYRGKSDYYYYFLAMAAEKLRPGGRLCVITPAGWMNAGNADWLRERLADMLRLDQLFLFGSMRLFATEVEERDVRAGAAPPTVESAILVATRTETPQDHRLRVVLLEDEAEAAATLTGDLTEHAPPRQRLLAAMARRASGKPGRASGILVHDIPQANLRSTRPWPIKHAGRDTAARVVAHLQKRLDAPRSRVERLGERWHCTRGIETGADAYTARIQKRLPQQLKSDLTGRGLRTGDPILELPPGTAALPPWRDHPDALAHSPEPHALLYGAVDDANFVELVYLRTGDDPAPEVIDALEQWREVLRTRAEFVRNPQRAWWETAWPRDRDAMSGPKVIALYRTDRGRFALDEDGLWQPSNKTTIATPRGDDLSVAYLCGVLNSELLDLWYAVRGKVPRDIWRNYEPKPMNEMPYRHVPTPAEWEPDALVTALQHALAAGDVPTACLHAGEIAARTGTPPSDTDARVAIEHLVRAIAANRRALLPLRASAPELGRAVKNPWRTHGVTVEPAAVAAAMPSTLRRSVRIDPDLRLEIVTDGPLGRATMQDGLLRFTHARKRTATVAGPPARLELLRALLPAGRLLPDQLRSLQLPTDLDDFAAEVEQEQRHIDELLATGRLYAEAVERLVCALYGVPEPLTEKVIESAVVRAGAAGAGTDDD